MLIDSELAELKAALAASSVDAARGPSGGDRIRQTLTAIDGISLAIAGAAGVTVLGPAPAAVRVVQGAAQVVVGLVTMRTLKLDRARVSSVRANEVRRLLATAAVLGLAAMVVGGSQRMTSGLIMFACSFTVLCLERAVVSTWFRLARVSGRLRRPVLVIGTTNEAERVLELIVHHPELGYQAVGVVGERAAGESDVLGVPWLGAVEATTELVDRTGVSGVLVASSGLTSIELNRVVRDLHDRGVHVQLWSGMLGIAHRRVRVMPFAHEAMLYLEPQRVAFFQGHLKRSLDVVLAVCGLVVGAPILLAAAVAIKWDDGGPALFRQVRVGRDGKLFTCLKLRTMVPDAEARLAALESTMNERSGPLFKAENDPRTTRVGRFLRDASIDELPQLVNVLRGDMSLVGPRPALPSEVERFDEELRERHRVRPGVTGLWQLEARDNPSFFAYRHLDLFYVGNVSVGLDLMILSSTVWSVLGRGVAMTNKLRTRRKAVALRDEHPRQAAPLLVFGPLDPRSSMRTLFSGDDDIR